MDEESNVIDLAAKRIERNNKRAIEDFLREFLKDDYILEFGSFSELHAPNDNGAS